MFDIDSLEKEWYDNRHKLSEEEIYEIFLNEHVTYQEYINSINNYLIKNGYKTLEELNELKNMGKLSKKELKRILNNAPDKKVLSKEAQLKVVDGCLNYVFNNTRKWYKAFNYKISMEEIYDVCLEALILCIKKACHNGTMTFKNYINKEIKKEIVYFMACKENISFNKSQKIIKDIKFDNKGNIIDYKDDFNYEYNNEQLMSPIRLKKCIIKKETRD